jgi:hypothetical protein
MFFSYKKNKIKEEERVNNINERVPETIDVAPITTIHKNPKGIPCICQLKY